MDNLTIWFIGSNAVGKTTQAALLHLHLREAYQPDFVSKIQEFQLGEELKKHQMGIGVVECKYTVVSPVSVNLGAFNHPMTSQEGVKTNDCCGTDNLQTKVQIIKSYEAAKKLYPIVVVEGIMATGQWINFLKTDNKLMLILLDCPEETNFKRLRARRAHRLKVGIDEVILSERTQENLTGKLRGFRSLFDRMKPHVDVALSLDTSELSIQEIHSIIKDKFVEML